jgi:hypothetical protein
MIVELREQKLIDAKTRQPMKPLNWEIFIGNTFVGFLPFDNPRPVICMRLDDEELSTVMRHIRIKLHPQKVSEPLQTPEPPELKQDDSEYVDPFEAFTGE